MKYKSSDNRSRRGFSLVEVIVALTVIVIVSGAAISLIASHTRLEARTVQTVEATTIAENAIECFRYASDEDTFGSVFVSLYTEVDSEEYIAGYDFEELGNGSYKVTRAGATVTITPNYSDNKIEISATNNRGDNILDTVTYVKHLSGGGSQ